MVVGHDEAARGGLGIDGDRDGALAGLEDGREVAGAGLAELFAADRFAGEDFAAGDGAGQIGHGFGRGGAGDVFGADGFLGPFLPFEQIGREARADGDGRFGDEDFEGRRGRWRVAGAACSTMAGARDDFGLTADGEPGGKAAGDERDGKQDYAGGLQAAKRRRTATAPGRSDPRRSRRACGGTRRGAPRGFPASPWLMGSFSNSERRKSTRSCTGLARGSGCGRSSSLWQNFGLPGCEDGALAEAGAAGPRGRGARRCAATGRLRCRSACLDRRRRRWFSYAGATEPLTAAPRLRRPRAEIRRLYVVLQKRAHGFVPKARKSEGAG